MLTVTQELIVLLTKAEGDPAEGREAEEEKYRTDQIRYIAVVDAHFRLYELLALRTLRFKRLKVRCHICCNNLLLKQALLI